MLQDKEGAKAKTNLKLVPREPELLDGVAHVQREPHIHSQSPIAKRCACILSYFMEFLLSIAHKLLLLLQRVGHVHRLQASQFVLQHYMLNQPQSDCSSDKTVKIRSLVS